MNYDYYRIFYYAGKHLNLTKAAKELYSSQPAVSRAIQNLEQELGCTLFTRSRAGLEFTHEGAVLYEYASSAFRLLFKGEDAVSQSVNVESGTIFIGATVTALHGYLFDALNRFHKLHPSVKFRINTGSTNGCVEKINDGTVDLAFVSTPCKILKDLHFTKLTTFNDILIAGNDFLRLKDKVLSLNDLSRYPYVSLRKGMQLREFIDGIFAENDVVVQPDIEADGADLIVPMITNNFGLGFVPQEMASKAISRGEVFRIKLLKELPPRNIIMITSGRHPQTNASRELYKLIKSGL